MALFSKKSDEPRRRRDQPVSERANEADLQQRYAFRRNRTLTGSASSLVASATEAGADLRSPRVKAHELARQRRHLGLVLLLVVVVAGLLFWLIAQFTAGVVVKAKDHSIALDRSYEKAIQGYFARQPIERLRFLLNASALNDYVRAQMPEVATISSEGSAGFGRSSFIVTLRQPIVGWSINGHRQFVDATGTAFERNYFRAPPVQIVDNSGVQVNAGQAIASNRFLGFVGRLVGLVKAQGFITEQVVIPTGTTRQLELKIQGLGYPIKCSTDRGAGEQVEDMARTIAWLGSHGITPEYLDVRIAGKAFYR